jgi:transcriptional regulator with XRE-family HTH domain
MPQCPDMITPRCARRLGTDLQLIRNSAGLTLLDGARLSGISLPHISHIEHSRRPNLPASKLAVLHQAFGATPDEIRDMWFQARIRSALEEFGLSPDDESFMWEGIASRLTEKGFDVRDPVLRAVDRIRRGRA